MGGRVKRRAAEAATAGAAARLPVEPERCALCDRALGTRTEWHHAVPKAQGGRETVPVHPICHRAIHAVAANGELAKLNGDMAAVRALPEIARFIRWVANKPPDFHAPTRTVRR